MKYTTTFNKDIIRKYDKEKINILFLNKDRKLKYIGLPSPELNDILEWKGFFNRFVAIERGEKFDRQSKPHNLLLNATILGLRQKLTLIRGELDDVLRAGKIYSEKKMDYPFDVAFFDFFGGIINNNFNRVNSLKKFFEMQSPNDFLLLMTFNLRHTDETEELIVINNIEKELRGVIRDEEEVSKFSNVLDWYKSNDNIFRQKIFVPYLIREAEFFGYNVYSEKPIFYFGYNESPMIHFTTWLKYTGNHTTRAISDQTLIEVIDLDLSTVKDGIIVKCDLQAPKLLK